MMLWNAMRHELRTYKRLSQNDAWASKEIPVRTLTRALTTSESPISESASKTAALLPVLKSMVQFATAVMVHFGMSTIELTITLKLVSRSIWNRLDGMLPPLSKIFVSAPTRRRGRWSTLSCIRKVWAKLLPFTSFHVLSGKFKVRQACSP